MPTDFLSMNDLSDGELQTLLDWGEGYRPRAREAVPAAPSTIR